MARAAGERAGPPRPPTRGIRRPHPQAGASGVDRSGIEALPLTEQATYPPATGISASPNGHGDRLSALLESVGEAILTIDRRGAIESVNGAGQRLFACPASELVGLPFERLLTDPHRGEHEALTTAFGAGQPIAHLGGPRDVLARRSDGSTVPIELSITQMAPQGEPLLVAVARDVSARKRMEQRLRSLADRDPLTGLLNRRAFEQALARHVDYAARYGGAGSLLLLDVDNFKYVNDSLGHAAGDELIRGVAALISRRLRRTDVLARLGGDEFALLLHAANGAQARTIAGELRELIGGHPFVLDHQPVRVTVSVGVAPLDEGRLTGPELLANADVAMYDAKEQGRDRVVEFTPAGQAELTARRALSERIRKATEQGLFVLVCQPILDLRRGEITQYELLLRMRGEDGQLIAPAAFLDTAERFGLIQGIDRWVAQQAVRLIASQAKHGRELVLEVNLSGLTMNDPEFAARVAAEVTATGIDPSLLVFEVTETAAVADLDQARRFAESLCRIGCRFALDDFGAGFASFYYLKHLPVSYLKIDGEFVRELVRNGADQVMVRALVQVSEGLGIKTIAEFVGDQETLELLRGYGVDFAQGYHVGRPRPVAELRAASA